MTTELANLAEQAAAAGTGLQTLFSTLIDFKNTQDEDRQQAQESQQSCNNEIYAEMRKMRAEMEEVMSIDRKQINEGF